MLKKVRQFLEERIDIAHHLILAAFGSLLGFGGQKHVQQHQADGREAGRIIDDINETGNGL